MLDSAIRAGLPLNIQLNHEPEAAAFSCISELELDRLRQAGSPELDSESAVSEIGKPLFDSIADSHTVCRIYHGCRRWGRHGGRHFLVPLYCVKVAFSCFRWLTIGLGYCNIQNCNGRQDSFDQRRGPRYM